MAMTITEREEHWRGWLDTIKQDITTVYLWRATWLAVGDIVRANSEIPPSHFWAYMSNTYGTSQAIAVRRLADNDRRVVSLVTLIKDLRKHALEITSGLVADAPAWCRYPRVRQVPGSHY